MAQNNLASYRLVNQQISCARSKNAGDVVAALGAVQAQDYTSALWAIGLRLPDATETSVELAISERKIIRTWAMRGTLHFIAAEDIRWMLELLGPRTIAKSARRFQQLELGEKVFSRTRKLFIRALEGNRQLTRAAMMGLLESAGISTTQQRGYHILWRLAQEGLICFGARQGKQQTFALLEEWAPSSNSLEREVALGELARRYFFGHGPATLQDFVWWTGLTISEAKIGLSNVCLQLLQQVVDGVSFWMPQEPQILNSARGAAYLLPGFDEYLLGYKDRSAVLEPRHSRKIVPGGNGMFLPTIVIEGRVVGTWKRVLKKHEAAITFVPFEPLRDAEQSAVATAAQRYRRFLGL
ncbi:MAG: winged helix DNA-binding domain-containing protein [Acidobacteriota bacterium]|nr:winged helix DNA-binding domain-containing protein [Acidobacteriota bacterium]